MSGQHTLLLIMLAASCIAASLFVEFHLGKQQKADIQLSLSDLVPDKDFHVERLSPDRLRFAVAPVFSPRATLENYEAFTKYLAARLRRPVELVQGSNYAQINALLRTGDVTFGLVCSGAFVIGRQEFQMQPLAVPVIAGKNTYSSYLIVPAKSSARGWHDLRGKTFAFTDPLSNTGRLVPVYALARLGTTPDSFFKSVIFTYSHDKSIEAVAEGLVDGAAVDSMVYDFLKRQNQQLTRRVKIIWESSPYGLNPVVTHPRVPQEIWRTVRDILLDMHRDPDGRQVLKNMGVDSFELPDPKAFHGIETMLRTLGVLAKSG
ncbi:MAG: phosphate/phosphite/phosphonate ABC transporter substrate-binding protein [Cyanobacteria bacterium NC_groundwater_1444_Ag_S-0.65um_54_12]|nr:phosphate/phosphite/phosphonate ABC transporter substrate-binding protein [Cyanobacteria bacterium NC_groundwater_1444_Ag_S-0.65um_54_12]